RADELPIAVLLAHAVDLRADDARGADLPDPALRLHRSIGRARIGRVLFDRERTPICGDPLFVRYGPDGRRRALPEHAQCDPRQPCAAEPALLRALAAGLAERRVRVRVLVVRG